MNTHSKNHLIYIALLALLSYIGIHLGVVSILFTENDFKIRVFSHLLIILNAYLVYFSLLEMKASETASFALASLYVLNPAHLGIALFPTFLQVQIAETFLLIFILLFFKKKVQYSLISFLVAILLNTKLILIAPFLLFSKRLSWREKALVFIVFCYFLLQMYPLFLKQRDLIWQNFNSPLFYIEALLLPVNLNFLNFSLLYKNFYPLPYVLGFGLFVITILTFLYVRKNPAVRFLSVLLLVQFLSFLIPFKPFFMSGEDQYFFIAPLYPCALLIIIFSFFTVSKMMRQDMFLILMSIVGLFWLVTNISFQQSSNDLLAMWNSSIERLGDNLNFEEDIKFRYAEILIKNRKFEEAENFINANILKFPKERWYGLLLNLATVKQDKNEFQRIYKLMLDRQIPMKL